MRFNAKALVSFIAACIGLIALSLDGAYAAAEIRDICPAEFTSFDSPHLTAEDEARLAGLEKRLQQAELDNDLPAQAQTLESIGLLRYTTAQFEEAVTAFSKGLALDR